MQPSGAESAAEVGAAPEGQAAAPAPTAQRKRRGTAEGETPTPAAKKRRCSNNSSKKQLPEEPVEPKRPPSAFVIFSKSKWSVLVGESQARLEQAKLMWNALDPNSRSAFECQASELKAQYQEACEAYRRDFEAYRKALPPAARAELKKKEKEAAQAEKIRARDQAKELKEQLAQFRVRKKDMGDRFKDNLQICKRGGMWEVPDGHISFKNISYALFIFLFGHLRSKFSGASKSSPVISFQLNQAESGTVFGVTKLRGGSMYAKFEVCSMSVTFHSSEGRLHLGYKMSEYF